MLKLPAIPPTKLQKVSESIKESVSWHDENGPRHEVQNAAAFRFLYQTNVIVLLGDDVAVANNHPRYIVIGLVNMISPDAKGLNPEAIRYEHLSWSSFVEMMKDIDADYDCEKRMLVYALPDEHGRMVETEISDEHQFVWAVGNLHWHAQQEALGRNLMMILRERPGC